MPNANKRHDDTTGDGDVLHLIVCAPFVIAALIVAILLGSAIGGLMGVIIGFTVFIVGSLLSLYLFEKPVRRFEKALWALRRHRLNR